MLTGGDRTPESDSQTILLAVMTCTSKSTMCDLTVLLTVHTAHHTYMLHTADALQGSCIPN